MGRLGTGQLSRKEWAGHEGPGAPRGRGPEKWGSPGILGLDRTWRPLEWGSQALWGLGSREAGGGRGHVRGFKEQWGHKGRG
jgi:hypothetical protein